MDDHLPPPAATWMTAEVNPSSRTFRKPLAYWPTRDDAADSLVEATVVGRRGLKNVETFAVIREDDLEDYVVARLNRLLEDHRVPFLALDPLPCRDGLNRDNRIPAAVFDAAHLPEVDDDGPGIVEVTLPGDEERSFIEGPVPSANGH